MTLPSLSGSNLPEEDSGQRIQDLFENAPVGLWEVDAAGYVALMNQKLLQRLGLERLDRVERRRLEDLVSPESIAAAQAIAERCRVVGQVTGVTLRWRDTQG